MLSKPYVNIWQVLAGQGGKGLSPCPWSRRQEWLWQLATEEGVTLALETGPSLSQLVMLRHKGLVFLPSQLSRTRKCGRQEAKPDVRSLYLL